MKTDNIKTLIDAKDMAVRVRELGQAISRDYADITDPLVVISILKGSIPFTADLIRAITVPMDLEVMVASSYGSGTVSSGKVKLEYASFRSIRGKDVLLVDDVTDSGFTMACLIEKMKEEGAASVRACSFLNKPARREVDVAIDYIGFDVPDKFLVGYGMDYDQRYRELPDVCYIESEDE
jgi:hypoxanthine phosphoribosyltransferase